MFKLDRNLDFWGQAGSIWAQVLDFFWRKNPSSRGLSPVSRHFKRQLLAIDLNSASDLDLPTLTKNIIALFSDPGFEELDYNERAWIFAQVHCIYAKAGHKSGLDVIPSAERQFGILARDSRLHLVSLCTAYDLLYFLYWCWTNSIDDQRGFAHNVVRPFSAAIRRNHPSTGIGKRSIREKPIVGLLAQFLSPTPGNALAFANMLVLRSLIASGYKTALFAWAHHDPATLEEVRAMGVDVYVVNLDSSTDSKSNCIKNLESLLADVRPDVLITEMNSAVPAVLFERRVAPVQILYQTGLPFWPLEELDGVLNSWGVDPAKLELAPEKSFFIPAPISLPEYNKDIDSDFLVEERKKFPPGRLIGCYGRISKITPEYIRTASAIVEGLHDVTVIIGGPGDAQTVRAAVDESACTEKFVVVEGFVDGQVWGHLLTFFLDSYPQPGGLAVLEMISKGKPVVHMNDADVPNFGKFKVPELIADTPKAYIEIARRLLIEPEFYDEMVRSTHALSETHTSERDYAVALSAAVNKCLQVASAAPGY